MLLFLGKADADSRAFAQCAVQVDAGIVEDGGVLHNGKPQTGSAGLSGMAFVYPVKALKDPSLFTFRDSDPIICHTVERMPFPVAYHDPHMTILFCIANCIVCNIKKHLIEYMADTLDLLCSRKIFFFPAGCLRLFLTSSASS